MGYAMRESSHACTAALFPPIETVAHVAAVVQRDVLFQHGRAWTQCQFDDPLHPVNAIGISDGHGALPSGFAAYAKSTGDIETQLCETGKLNSTPKAAHAPRYPICAFLMEGLA